MNKKLLTAICFVGVILFIIGIVIVMRSVSMGNGMLDSMITGAGASMENERANMLLSAYINNIRIMGISLIALGGVWSTIAAISIARNDKM